MADLTEIIAKDPDIDVFEIIFAEDEDGPDKPRTPIEVGDVVTHCVGGHRTAGTVFGKQGGMIRFLPDGAITPIFFDLRPNGMYWRFDFPTGYGGYLRFKKDA